MTKKCIKPILITVIQIIGLVIIHTSVYHFFPIKNKEVGFGLTVLYAGGTFSVLILAFNFYLYFFKKHIYLISFVLFTISIFMPLMAFDYRPLRSLFLIVLVLCGFLSSVFFKKMDN